MSNRVALAWDREFGQAFLDGGRDRVGSHQSRLTLESGGDVRAAREVDPELGGGRR